MNWTKLAPKMTKKSQNQHLQIQSADRLEIKFKVACDTESVNSTKFVDSMTSNATLSSISGRSYDCLGAAFDYSSPFF